MVIFIKPIFIWSNFKIIGFTCDVSALKLVGLSKNVENNIAVIEDMGSGILKGLSKYGFISERTVEEALNEGVDIVTFSGDKMLGGPQAGIIAGKKKYVDLMKKNQMYRCLRIDKMCLAALEATLLQYHNNSFLSIPVIKSILETKENIYDKANRLNTMLEGAGINSSVKPHPAMTGGGALPAETIESYAVFITLKDKSAQDIDNYLRNQTIPIISTIQNEQVILNMRTVNEEDFEYITNILTALCKS